MNTAERDLDSEIRSFRDGRRARAYLWHIMSRSGGRVGSIRRTLLCAVAAALFALGSAQPADALPSCAFYSVTTPLTGTLTDSPCSPDTPFTHLFPIGVCVTWTWAGY